MKGRKVCLESKQKCQPGGAWARSRHAVSEVPLLPTGKEKSVIGRLSCGALDDQSGNLKRLDWLQIR